MSLKTDLKPIAKLIGQESAMQVKRANHAAHLALDLCRQMQECTAEEFETHYESEGETFVAYAANAFMGKMESQFRDAEYDRLKAIGKEPKTKKDIEIPNLLLADWATRGKNGAREYLACARRWALFLDPADRTEISRYVEGALTVLHYKNAAGDKRERPIHGMGITDLRKYLYDIEEARKDDRKAARPPLVRRAAKKNAKHATDKPQHVDTTPPTATAPAEPAAAQMSKAQFRTAIVDSFKLLDSRPAAERRELAGFWTREAISYLLRTTLKDGGDAKVISALENALIAIPAK